MGDAQIIQAAIKDKKTLTFDYTTGENIEVFYYVKPLALFKAKKSQKELLKAIIIFREAAEDLLETETHRVFLIFTYETEKEEEEEIKIREKIIPRFRVDRMENVTLIDFFDKKTTVGQLRGIQ